MVTQFYISTTMKGKDLRFAVDVGKMEGLQLVNYCEVEAERCLIGKKSWNSRLGGGGSSH